MDYKKAGVDIEAGYKSVELMKEHVKKTMRAYTLFPSPVYYPFRQAASGNSAPKEPFRFLP